MKKIFSLTLAFILSLVFTACSKNNSESVQDENGSSSSTENILENEAENETNSSDTPDDEKDSEKTVANALFSDFEKLVNDNPEINVQEIADNLLKNEKIKFNGVTTTVEEGNLSGFDNAEIKGFKEGVMFAPMIGSIAFVGYVFETEDDISASELTQFLKENANLRWNLCVEADELVAKSIDNKVFFVMSPKSFE